MIDRSGPGRLLADQAFSRAAGAPLIHGNHVRLLRDAAENYPAWADAIAAARDHVYFETYIIHEDRQGTRFADLLIAQARRGVRVYVLYDWLGGLGNTSPGFWRTLRDAGAEVRAFNPPALTSAFGWINRDHRKVVCVDRDIAFVSGLCVGEMWAGNAASGREPWRDTGTEIRGPAVVEVERAFAAAWATAGPPLPEARLARPARPPIGSASLRVIAGEPHTGGLYRLDKLVAALARHRLWLTDAYFVGGSSYVQALVAAAKDGVDVRLLVPGSSDLPLVRNLSRASYRPLLSGGVRVYEWNGTMLHAKTAVADGHWARVGSTNLNVASWLGNWELDVAVEDDVFAGQLEQMFLDDLQHSTEIVLNPAQRVRLSDTPERRVRGAARRRGRAGRALAGVVGIGHTVGAAVATQRLVGPAEARVVLSAAVALLMLAAFALMFPRLLAVPVALVGGWTGLSLLIRAYQLRQRGNE